jgi:ribosomal protein S19
MLKKYSSSLIHLKDIGREFVVYTGKMLQKVKVVEGMENTRFGSYILTKKLGPRIHIKKIKKKKKK